MTIPTKTPRAARLLALLTVSAPLLSACMTSTPIWDKHFGESVTTLSRAQMVNPDAPEAQPPLTGVDGKTAVTAMSNYDRSMIRIYPGGGMAGSSGMATGVGMGTGYSDSGMISSGSH